MVNNQVQTGIPPFTDIGNGYFRDSRGNICNNTGAIVEYAPQQQAQQAPAGQQGTPPFQQGNDGYLYDSFNRPCDTNGMLVQQMGAQQQPMSRSMAPRRQAYQDPNYAGGNNGAFVERTSMYDTPRRGSHTPAVGSNETNRYASQNTTVKPVERVEPVSYYDKPGSMVTEPVKEVKLTPYRGNEFKFVPIPGYKTVKAPMSGGTYYEYKLEELPMDQKEHDIIYDSTAEVEIPLDETGNIITSDTIAFALNSKRVIDSAMAICLNGEGDSVVLESLVVEPLYSDREGNTDISVVYSEMVTKAKTLVELGNAIKDKIEEATIAKRELKLAAWNAIDSKLTKMVNFHLVNTAANIVSMDLFSSDAYDLSVHVSKMSDLRKKNIVIGTLSDALAAIKGDVLAIITHTEEANELLSEYTGPNHSIIGFPTRLAVMHVVDDNLTAELNGVTPGETMQVLREYAPVMYNTFDKLKTIGIFKDNSNVMISINNGNVYRIALSKMAPFVIMQIR